MKRDHRSFRQTFLSALTLLIAWTCVLVGQEDISARIERVENNLLPPVLIKGEKGWVLEERMKHYKVPGVSVAVFRDFTIEWARAYGVKDVETNAGDDDHDVSSGVDQQAGCGDCCSEAVRGRKDEPRGGY